MRSRDDTHAAPCTSPTRRRGVSIVEVLVALVLLASVWGIVLVPRLVG